MESDERKGISWKESRENNVIGIGVQTRNVVCDENPQEGFHMLKEAGFDCCDFSLNGYLKNTDIYKGKVNPLFNCSEKELESFFSRHKESARIEGVTIHQMHMPYPIFSPKTPTEMNEYLRKQVAVKSMQICYFLGCRYIVVHGFKLARYLGSEELEWQETASFLETILPMAKEYGITVCMENLYESVSGHMEEGPGCDVVKAVQRIDDFNERYGAEVLGFCFDAGHANLVGIDFEEFLTTLGSRLKVLHLHDNDGRTDLHQIPYTFARTGENTTSVNWEDLIRGLKATKFDGVLNFETAQVLKAFPEEMKFEALQFIAKIGKYWRSELLA